MGRPAIEIDEKVCEKAEALAAQGLTREQIAAVLGMGASTLYEKQKAFPELLEAIKRGGAKGLATITNSLFQSAKGGNVTAQIFYLKNRDPEKWKDRRTNELTGKDEGPIKMQALPFEFVKPQHEDATDTE